MVKKYKHKGLTERTVKVLSFIDKSLEGKEEVSLDEILEGTRKKKQLRRRSSRC